MRRPWRIIHRRATQVRLSLHHRVMKALQGSTRLSFLAFFGSHIAASLLIDAQAVLPPSIVPTGLQSLLGWYAQILKDPLMSRPQEILWFRSLICCELLFQVPYFFMACFYLFDSRRSSYPLGFQYASIAYASHTATTLVPILATLATNTAATTTQRNLAITVYLPYLVFPLWLLYLATRPVSASAPLGKHD